MLSVMIHVAMPYHHIFYQLKGSHHKDFGEHKSFQFAVPMSHLGVESRITEMWMVSEMWMGG